MLRGFHAFREKRQKLAVKNKKPEEDKNINSSAKVSDLHLPDLTLSGRNLNTFLLKNDHMTSF